MAIWVTDSNGRVTAHRGVGQQQPIYITAPCNCRANFKASRPPTGLMQLFWATFGHVKEGLVGRVLMVWTAVCTLPRHLRKLGLVSAGRRHLALSATGFVLKNARRHPVVGGKKKG